MDEHEKTPEQHGTADGDVDGAVDGAAYDVVVVGGGAAGLSGALTLARARRRVLVVDAGTPRNAPADRVHGYLGLEGVSPADLVATGRREVRGYGGEVLDGTVTAVRPDAGAAPGFGLDVRTDDGRRSVRARRLLVTTGLVDGLPDLDGLAEGWGRDVLHCPFCHGWEVGDGAVVVLGVSAVSVHQALLWSRWTPTVTLLRQDVDLDADQRADLAAAGVTLAEGVTTAVVRAGGSDGALQGVRLEDGTLLACRAVVVATSMQAGSEVLEQLGLETAQVTMNGAVMGHHVPADPMGRTAVPGVWVAGNVTDLGAQVLMAAAAGQRAGAALHGDLMQEELGRA